MSLTIIGDVHGKYLQYIAKTNMYPHTLQLGDMGFNYAPINILGPDHKFFGGNHDNYDTYFGSSQIIGNGNFGTATLGGVKFFFVRGGHSIDWKYRTAGVSWWAKEELNKIERNKAVKAYKEAKPDIVISHEAPTFVNRRIGSKGILPSFGYSEDWSSNTAQMLHSMFNGHVPQLWFHGHMHKSHKTSIEGCMFIGLNELETYTI